MDDDGGRRWEDQIDFDDSDLPSLLLRPCSQSQALRLKPTSFPPHQKQPLLLPLRRLIPGPAGAVQAAMHRQALASRSVSDGGAESGAVQDVTNDGDGDFKLHPWLCASAFLGQGSCSAMSSPISSIKSHRSTHRIEQVVGIVNSCRSNGLGGLFITLKDPSGTIGAFIHHKVLKERSFGGGDLAVGCVLILKQVVVFFVRASGYLNITINNVVKLITKDSVPPQRSMFTTSIALGKENESEHRVGDMLTFKLGAENFVSIDSPREHHGFKLGVADKRPLLKEVPNQSTQEDTIKSMIKQKRSKIDRYLEEPHENLPCISNSLAATVCTRSGEARTSVVTETENRALTSSDFMDANAMDEPVGRLSSSRCTSAATTSEMMAEKTASWTGHAIGDVLVKLQTKDSRVDNGTTDRLAISSVPAKSNAKKSESKTIISIASVTEWTDEQITELFSDYQDADEMDKLFF